MRKIAPTQYYYPPLASTAHHSRTATPAKIIPPGKPFFYGVNGTNLLFDTSNDSTIF